MVSKQTNKGGQMTHGEKMSVLGRIIALQEVMLHTQNEINKLRDQKIHKLKKYNGEFDPGSGRTLAACLTHASLRRTFSSENK